MEWLAVGLLAAAAATVFFVYTRWVLPWRKIERLVDAIGRDQPPATFLLRHNPHSLRVGLALEKLWRRQRELNERVHAGEFSVRAILDAVLDGLVVVDDQRRVQLSNPAFRKLAGREDVNAGVPLMETLRHASVDRLVGETLRSNEPRREVVEVSPRSGEALQIEVCAMPLEPHGPARGAVVLFRDMSQSHRVEQMRRDFVANVSHELRTPLSIVRGYLETLLENPAQPPGELLRIFGVMEKHSQRLTLLVEDILTLARLESPGSKLELTGIHLTTFISAILRDWDKRLGVKKLQAHLELAPNLPVLSADENRLHEVFDNLLDNAVKFSPEGGEISIRAARMEESIQLSVCDRGTGISARDLPRIFERFYRADKARGPESIRGTGLGLSIVKHIVQLHDGRVEAQSEIGRGTTVAVTLPIKGPAQRDSPAPSQD